MENYSDNNIATNREAEAAAEAEPEAAGPEDTEAVNLKLYDAFTYPVGIAEFRVVITGLSGDSEDVITSSVNVFVSLPMEFFAVRVNVYLPAVVGVPVSVPVDA